MAKQQSRISSIGEVIHSVFARLDTNTNPTREDIDLLWKEVVGPDGFRHSRPVSIRNRVLTVRVDNSVWIQELSMKKRSFLKGLKRKLGKDRISEINFKIGELNA